MADTSYGPAALEHYRRLGVHFDCIYSGYLATPEQTRLVEQAIAYWPDALSVVDPVLGDNGRVYSGIPADLVGAMYTLCCRADLIVPNLTEASILLEAELPHGAACAEQAGTLAAALTKLAPAAVITGVPDGRCIGCAGASRNGGSFFVRHARLPRSFPGTGDIFGAVLAGRLVKGNVLEAAADTAAQFVGSCIQATPDGADPRLGVWLERALPGLMEPQPPDF
jgi:pyridoxine kinase